MSGPILLTLAYALLAVSAVAFLVRTVKIARLPIHLRWELAPVPKERTRGKYGGSYLEEHEWWKKPREESLVAELSYMLREILFLKALWEHNRRLWWSSYPFHLGLYLLVGAAGLVLLAGAVAAAGMAGPGWGLLSGILPVVAGVGYALGAAGALGLFASRLADPKLRTYTTPVALFNLALLGVVFVTGLGAVLTVPSFPGQMAGLAGALLAAQPPGEVSGILAAHVVSSLVFLAYLPFSQMMHFVAKYFTYHQVRWDDRPLEVGGSIEREVKEMLQRPVSWAAPHMGADGQKSWAELASGAPAGEEVAP